MMYNSQSVSLDGNQFVLCNCSFQYISYMGQKLLTFKANRFQLGERLDTVETGLNCGE